MMYVRNIDRKMKVETEENFQKTVMNEINNLKKRYGTKVVSVGFPCYLIAYNYQKDG